MISFRALTTASLLGLLVTLAGCSAESGTASGADTTAKSKDTASAVTAGEQVNRGPQHGPGRGGPEMMLVGTALHDGTVNLTAEQKATIEAAIAANKPAAAPAFDKTRVSALAAGIRSGKIDAAAVSAPQGPSAEMRAAHQAGAAKVLATLHSTLTPEQRTALVAAVTKHGEGHGPKGDRAHGPKGERSMHGGHAGPMGGMLEGLDLTQAQQDSIKTKLEAQRPAAPSEADRAAMKSQHEAMRTAMQTKLQTFATDSFDATAFVTPPAGAPAMKGPGAERFATDLQIITSVLEPAQREKLAARIEAGPPARGTR